LAIALATHGAAALVPDKRAVLLARMPLVRRPRSAVPTSAGALTMGLSTGHDVTP
jgi:hypothetical protein